MPVELAFLPGNALGLSPLSRRLLAERPGSELAPGLIVPARLEQIPELEREDDALFVDRIELVERLRERVEGAPVGVARSLEKLSDPRSLAVVCGQQPGLAGGPLYNLYKGLHACRLAAALEERFARPVVPIFWNHADDHDLSEVNHAHFLNRHLDVARIGLAGLGSGRQPFSRIAIEEQRHCLGAFVASAREMLPKRPEREPALACCAPRAGETLASAFTRTWTQLLGHLGLLVVEPDDLRQGASRALARLVALDGAGAVRAAEQRLTAEGFGEPQHDAHAWCFRVGSDGRQPLRHAAGGYRYDGEPGSRSGIELAAEIVAEPQGWSAGALLRPLVQDLCLPTIAYVGGHGELAYHALLPELRRRAGLPAPVFVPRLSATVVSPAAGAAAAKAGLSLADVLRRRGELREPEPDAAAEPAEPAEPVVERIRRINAEFTERLLAEREGLAEVDRALALRLRQSTLRAAKLIDAIARKAERAARNRAGKGQRHLRRLSHSWFPRGAPQERHLTTLQYVAAFGPGWIDELYAQLDPLPTEHLAVLLPNRPGIQGEPTTE